MSEKERLEKVHEEMGLLERILSYIPGYRGYKKKELRRESDRLVRMEVVNRLRVAKDILRRNLSDPTVVQRISSEDAWRCDMLSSRLDRVTQRIDRAVAGYAGMFDAVRVRDDRLETVIQHDLSLIERAEAIKANAETLFKIGLGKEKWRKVINDLITRIEELDMLVDKRIDIIRGLTR